MRGISGHGKYLFAFGVLLIFCRCAFALDSSLDVSQYAHTAWKVREGFSKGSITSIAQTPDGYLWLGTEYGLLRFDGVRTTPWEPPPGEQLPSVYVRSLLVARDAALWIGTAEGLARWKDGKLTVYKTLAGESIDALLEDREGTVWAGGSAAPAARLCAIPANANKQTECYGEDGSFGQHVNSLYEDSDGGVWVGALTGLWRWTPGPPKLYAMPTSVNGTLTIDYDNSSTGKGGPLFSVAGEIRRLVHGNPAAYPLPKIPGQFTTRALLWDHDGGLWIGTTNRGLIHVHEGRADVFGQADGLSGDFIEDLFEDREGNIWVATIDGLDRFCDFAVHTLSAKQGLSNPTVESVMAAQDGSVWLATLDGLNRLDKGQITVYRKRNGLPYDAIESLFEDSQGQVWVATHRGIAYGRDGQFQAVAGVPGQIHGFACDRGGNIWVSQALSLFHLYQGKVIEEVSWASLGRPDGARSLTFDLTRGGLWLGFRDGGVGFYKDGKIRAMYGTAEGVGRGHLKDLRLERDGVVWASTEGGLSRIENGHAITMASANGLPCDTVHWSLRDDDRDLWVDTGCGLARIRGSDVEAWVKGAEKDPSQKIKLTVFDNSDGVRSHATTTGYSPSVAKSSDGRIWFLPWDGVSVLDPRHLEFNKIPPPVHVERIVADRKTYDASSDADLGLPALIRDLEIDYTGLSFVAPQKMRFRYKLEGYDGDWQEVGDRREAFYSNLAPGNYRFRVSASNNDGVWNDAGASLDFSVAPAYYQTAWFRMLCLAGFVASLWGIYAFRMRQLAQQFNMRVEARVGERTRIARELHDTLLQSVQGLILKFYAVAKQIPKEQQVRQSMENALDYADQVLAEGRERVRNLRESTESLSDLPAAFQRVVEESPRAGEMSFKAVAEGPVRELHPVVLEEAFAIGREALLNAFSHSGGLHVEAEIMYDSGEFCLRIRDDGRGIDPGILEKGGRPDHWGLQGMRERAKNIGAQLLFWSRPGTGTEIELKVPSATAYRSPQSPTKWQWFRRSSSVDSERL
jgi:signal transduction histidine kinase/ligand-binding sensor domain-containing protein